MKYSSLETRDHNVSFRRRNQLRENFKMVTVQPVSEMKERKKIHADRPPKKLPLCILASNWTKSAHRTCKMKQCGLDGAGRICVQRTDLIQPRGNASCVVW